MGKLYFVSRIGQTLSAALRTRRHIRKDGTPGRILSLPNAWGVRGRRRLVGLARGAILDVSVGDHAGWCVIDVFGMLGVLKTSTAS